MYTYDVFLGNGSTYRSYFITATSAMEAITEAKERAFRETGLNLIALTVEDASSWNAMN